MRWPWSAGGACHRVSPQRAGPLQSTDFGSIVSPLGAGYRRHFASGGGAGIYPNQASSANVGVPAPPSPSVPGISGGYLPTVASTLSDNGISPAYGQAGSTLLGLASAPLGLAMTGYNTLAQINNTAQNASMLSSMGDPLGIGQMIGGALGLNGYGGSATGALNAAMNTDAGRAALSTPQASGELPDVSMPTQTAPLTPVTSQPLSGNQSAGNGGGSNAQGFGAAGQGTSVGVGNDPSGPGGMGGMARGGRVAPGRHRAPHLIVVVPHPIMGALMMAAMGRR